MNNKRKVNLLTTKRAAYEKIKYLSRVFKNEQANICPNYYRMQLFSP